MRIESVNIPPRFIDTVTREFGEKGGAWIRDLPFLLKDVAIRFSLQVEDPFRELSINYLAKARLADGTPVVLKLGVPDTGLLPEAEALKIFDGRGALRLLGGSPAEGILILERLNPGTPLAALPDDDQAVTIAAGIMQKLHSPSPSNHLFPTVADWGRGFAEFRSEFNGQTGPFPAHIFEAAERIFAELVASTDTQVVLHGDLHHWNICSTQREPWLAIDPKGVVGDPAYEAGAFLRNPFPQLLARSDAKQHLRRSIQLFSERLEIAPDRLAGWGFSQAVLSGIWAQQAGDEGWNRWVEIAKLIREC